MKKTTRYVGMDVHADTIAVAVAEGDADARSLGVIPNRIESIRKLLKKVGSKASLRVCYEAGPCGYALYWQLVEFGVKCEVVAPTLVPTKPGDRVKTDRRDALKLARSYRSGDLTAVWVPDREHEALRDLVRAREAVKEDQRRARHRLGKFLLRHGLRKPQKMTSWGTRHRKWLGTERFEQFALDATMKDYLHEVDHADERLERIERAIDQAVELVPAPMRTVIAALQAMRGVAKTTAVGVVVEVGEFSRFSHPRQLMGYSGAVPSEHSSGGQARRGAITKTGNGHLRRLLVESAWAYRHGPSLYPVLRRRQKGLEPEVTAIAWKAQVRLSQRYRKLIGRKMPPQKAVTAVARELLGFMWAIGVHVEQQCRVTRAA